MLRAGTECDGIYKAQDEDESDKTNTDESYSNDNNSVY